MTSIFLRMEQFLSLRGIAQAKFFVCEQSTDLLTAEVHFPLWMGPQTLSPSPN
jgi:hypothetical protein